MMKPEGSPMNSVIDEAILPNLGSLELSWSEQLVDL